MNVLTIDLDYMSDNYAKLVDNISYNDFTNKRWGEFYKNTYYSEDHFKVNIDNWLFILDVYTKAIAECSNVAFGYEHDSILFDLQDVDEPINILNIDHHHDICYVNEQYSEVIEYDIVSQADWVLWLVKNKNLASYTWVGNQNSTQLDTDVVQLNWNFNPLLKEGLKMDTYNFDYIYICASPQYLAPHHWYHFDIMKMLYKNICGLDPKVHQDKFGYDLKKYYKYKGNKV